MKLLNRMGHVIYLVCLFLLSRITCDVDFYYLCHSKMHFLILPLEWTNDFPCGTMIPYLMYWISMLRCNCLRFDTWYFPGSIYVLFYSKMTFPILRCGLARFPWFFINQINLGIFPRSGCLHFINSNVG